MACLNLKEHIKKNNSTLVRQGSPAIYQIHTDNTSICAKFKIKKCQFGTAKPGSEQKVIMMVGETGSGKSTMINAMFNYVVTVNMQDLFRFRLVDESEQAQTLTQADSQTDRITAYTLHHQEGFAVPYTLTIVDTPGFGDTAGKEQDKKLIEQIRMFFTTAGDAGINHIDAVGLVVNATQVRLTQNQKYIFNAILSLWGKDIEENIFIFSSFANKKIPLVLAALKRANIPYKTYFKFDNSTNFGNVGNDDDDSEFWEISIKGFDNFLMHQLDNVKSKSLTLSKSVLELRNMLKTWIKANKENIENIVFQQKKLNEHLAKLKNKETSKYNERKKEDAQNIRNNREIEKMLRKQELLNNELGMKQRYESLLYREANTVKEDKQLGEQLQNLSERKAEICNEIQLEEQNLNSIRSDQDRFMDNMVDVQKTITDHQRNANFIVEKSYEQLKQLPTDQLRAINCSECEKTCHQPCMAIISPRTCSIFKWKGPCTVCYCSSEMHNIQTFQYKRTYKTIKEIDPNLKDEHQQKLEELIAESDDILNQQKELKTNAKETDERITELRNTECKITDQQHQKMINARQFEQQEKIKREEEAEKIKSEIEELKLKIKTNANQLDEKKEETIEIADQQNKNRMKDAVETKNLQKQKENIKINLEAAQRNFFGLVMVQILMEKILSKMALQPVDQTAGWKECDYIEQMMQTEEKEKEDGWEQRITQLSAVLERSDELSRECNREFMQIIPEYKVDPLLSKEDNELLKENCKILQFKKKIVLDKNKLTSKIISEDIVLTNSNLSKLRVSSC